MTTFKQIFVFCLILTSVLGSSETGNLKKSVEPCEDICAQSYAPHTNPRGKDSESCDRGCRFYAMSYLVYGDHKKVSNEVLENPVKKLCYDTCVEAYNETSPSTTACKGGCDAQEKVSQNEVRTDDDEPPIHLLSPLLQVRAVYSSIIGTVHVIRTSLVTYFMSDDSTIVAVESEPEVIVDIPIEAVEDDGASPLQGLMKSRQLSDESDDPSVVQCVSRRLGVPPSLLVVSILALVLFTLYVIFAVCSTATPPTAKAYANGLSVQTDKLPLPVKLVRPEDLTRLSLMEEEDLEAPPLPTKVKLPDSEI